MSKKSKAVKQDSAAPRAKDDIMQEYSSTSYQAGNLQYQIEVYKRELSSLNKRMEDLNYEMAARNNVDAQENAKKAKDLADQAALAKATSDKEEAVANG